MDERLKQYDDKMQKTMNNLMEEFGSIRAGRANPHVLDKLRVDYYGSPAPIQQVANVTVPEARMIQIQPWEGSMVKAIEKGDAGADDIIPYMGNVLQDVTEKMHPIVRQIIDRMQAQGAKKAMMSGSGPSVFGIFETEEDAKRAKESFSDFRQVFVTHLV